MYKLGRSSENGNVVIYRYLTGLPKPETTSNYPWLTVIKWKYDGAQYNGMPSESERKGILNLEIAIENSLESKNLAISAYSKTGNGAKELVYYIRNRETFTKRLNKALKSHPQYPIEINFYEDKEWKDLAKLLKDANNS